MKMLKKNSRGFTPLEVSRKSFFTYRLKGVSNKEKFLTGFTIVEMSISVFILSIAVIGAYSAFSIIVILTSGASNRLTAAYLAQEGIEIIRNIRDSNWLSEEEDVYWDSGLSEWALGCQADYTTTGSETKPLIPWIGDGDYLDINEFGFFGYSANGQQTKFRRKITINENGNILNINAKVFWDEKPNIFNPSGAPGSIEADEILYDWY